VSLDDARAWMQDGDRLWRRAGHRMTGAGARSDAGEMDIATHDYARAAELYLTGAVAYQHGREGLERSAGPSTNTRRLVDALNGRLRAEAESAWRATHGEGGEALTDPAPRLASARAFADGLRDRFANAAPELFDRRESDLPARDAAATRGR
jgi:hypothetical protein